MALQIRFSALESTGIVLVCTKDLAAASLNEISNQCRDVRKKKSQILSQVQFLIVGVIRQHASPNRTLQIHPIWAIRAYSSSKSMGQEHRQQSSQSMGSNNSSKRIGKNIGGGSSSNSKSMGSSSIGQEEHWTRRVVVNSKSNSDISSKSNSGISSSKSSSVSSISSKSSSDRTSKRVSRNVLRPRRLARRPRWCGG